MSLMDSVNAKSIVVEDGPDENWMIKRTDEDGFVIKVDGSRLKTKNGHLTQRIKEIKADDKRGEEFIIVTLEDPVSATYTAKFRFSVNKYAGEETFSDIKTGKGFVEKWKETMSKVYFDPPAQDQGEGSQQKDQVPNVKFAKRKRKINEEINDILPPGPSKTQKQDNKSKRLAEIEKYRIGSFVIDINAVHEPPEEWLDRPISDDHVAVLFKELQKGPDIFMDGQSWLGIANYRLEEKESVDPKNVSIKLIGGLHRYRAYKKAMDLNGTLKAKLKKPRIVIYSDDLDTKQIRYLAARHNFMNASGSRQTPWAYRVKSCRETLFSMVAKDFTCDETPESTAAWRKACHYMFLEDGKDKGALETTLQMAQLKKDTFSLFWKVCMMFQNQELPEQASQTGKGRRKSMKEITQNQIGQPLQGLEDDTKRHLLQKVIDGEMTLKDITCQSKEIKSIKRLQSAFMAFANAEDWSEMKERFPLHTSEEKLFQFKDVKLVKNAPIPKELHNFFMRAVVWENDKKQLSETEESTEDDYSIVIHESRKKVVLGKCHSFGMDLLEADLCNVFSNFKGFQCIFINLFQNFDEDDLQLLLHQIHAINSNLATAYNVVLTGLCRDDINKFMTLGVKRRYTKIQLLWMVDTAPMPGEGPTLDNTLAPMILFQWNSAGILDVLNGKFKSKSNVFLYSSDIGSVYETLIDALSMPESTVLDVVSNNCLILKASIQASRRCFSFVHAADYLVVANKINVHTMNKAK